MPMTKYHFLVLCRKANIPAYTPTLPNIVAIKKRSPSEILSAPAFLERDLSQNIAKNATRFTAIKKVRIRNNRLVMFIILNHFLYHCEFFCTRTFFDTRFFYRHQRSITKRLRKNKSHWSPPASIFCSQCRRVMFFHPTRQVRRNPCIQSPVHTPEDIEMIAHFFHFLVHLASFGI